MDEKVESSTKKEKNDSLIQQAVKNAQSIEHNVEVLANLEISLQSSYLSMKSMVLCRVCSNKQLMVPYALFLPLHR